MNKLIRLSISVLIFVIVSCSGQQRDNIQVKVSKGDILFTHNSFSDRYNAMHNPEYLLLQAKSNKLIQLSEKYERYSFEIFSLSPSGNYIIMIDEQMKALTLFNLIKQSSDTILYSEMRKNIKPEYITKVEFLTDTIALLAADNNLFEYNIYSKMLSKIKNFNNHFITDIYIPKLNRTKIFLNFIDSISNDTIEFTSSCFDIKDGKLINENKIHLSNIYDISANGEYLIGWFDSLYIYDLDKKIKEKIDIDYWLVYMDQHKVKFYNQNSIITTDTFKKDDRYYSKVMIYNFREKRVINEFLLGEEYFEIIKVL